MSTAQLICLAFLSILGKRPSKNLACDSEFVQIWIQLLYPVFEHCFHTYLFPGDTAKIDETLQNLENVIL